MIASVPPILFIVFNRPNTTAQVFEAIRAVQPSKLYIAADGPRAKKEGEASQCEKVRAIATQVDWPCQVVTLFREVNLGCRKAVSQAITWFFEHEEAGIILEDDCLPHQDFFSFCDRLLHLYAHDNHVMHISGAKMNDLPLATGQCYYFSRYPRIWGWATWRRAWQTYDVDMTDYVSLSQKAKDTLFANLDEQIYYQKLFEKVNKEQVDTWDYQWNYAIWRQKGLCINPAVNLVSNIGFGPEATHTTNLQAMEANRPTSQLPVWHINDHHKPDEVQDSHDLARVISPSASRRLRFQLKRALGLL